MTRYIGGRLLQASMVLWGAYTTAYLILYLLPGDPLSIMLNASGVDVDSLSAADLARARSFYGLDRGMLAQYFTLLWAALHGDFGNSLNENVSVWSLISERLPQTLALGGLAITFSLLFGIGFAWVASYVTWQPLKSVLNRLPSLGFSIPIFWLGLLLIEIFAFRLGWFPSTGNDGFASLVLPAVTLSTPSMAVYAQVFIRGLNETWREPFIATAWAKGLTRAEIQRRHVFRNAILPVLTLVGMQIGHTVSGAVIIETLFARAGIGRLVQESVLRQDIPVVLAVVVLSATVFVLINLAIDLLYSLFDPRVARAPRVT